jgi:hypothetical protein
MSGLTAGHRSLLQSGRFLPKKPSLANQKVNLLTAGLPGMDCSGWIARDRFLEIDFRWWIAVVPQVLRQGISGHAMEGRCAAPAGGGAQAAR